MTADITPENVALMLEGLSVDGKRKCFAHCGKPDCECDVAAHQVAWAKRVLAQNVVAIARAYIALAVERDALAARLAEVEANLHAAKETIDEHFTAKEAAETRLAEANAKITQMSAGWGEDAVRVEELRKELAAVKAEHAASLMRANDEAATLITSQRVRAEAAEADITTLRACAKDEMEKREAAEAANAKLTEALAEEQRQHAETLSRLAAAVERAARAALQEKPHE
jgi:chromosome segregation ATPase